MAARPY